jgi:thiamine pyrophosphokinase
MNVNDNNSIVILADGSYPSGELALSILEGAVRVVCCDGAAAEFVARGGVPWAIVGDCDSISAELLARFSDIVHRNPDQETNDLTKSVRFCLARGYRNITILGATGRREDHTLGNISLLVDYAKEGADVRMVTDHGIFEPIFENTSFESYAGEQVSIFTLSPATLITTENLAYPLTDAPLTGWWQGTLNESLGTRFGIRTTGPALIYRLLDQTTNRRSPGSDFP